MSIEFMSIKVITSIKLTKFASIKLASTTPTSIKPMSIKLDSIQFSPPNFVSFSAYLFLLFLGRLNCGYPIISDPFSQVTQESIFDAWVLV